MADEHKALTVINLPFTKKRFNPGYLIPESDFEAEADAAAEANPDGHNLTAEEQIAHFREWGSLGDEGDDLHPDHRPVDANRQNAEQLRESARLLAEDYDSRGEDLPGDIRKLVDSLDGGEGA